MRYAQYKPGNKLHIVYEAGEGYMGQLVRAGFLSWPLCGKKGRTYRMTINVPLAHCCHNCMRVEKARRGHD